MLAWAVLATLALGAAVCQAIVYPVDYKCTACEEAMTAAASAASAAKSAFSAQCAALPVAFAEEICSLILQRNQSVASIDAVASRVQAKMISPLRGCQLLRLCPEEPQPVAAVSPLELRVTRGFGPNGYNKLRVSVISNASAPVIDKIFDYRSDFKYRWTSKFLSSGIVAMSGTQQSITINGITVSLNLPGV
jgi:hypothetical protein